MQKSLYNQRINVRGDNILHQKEHKSRVELNENIETANEFGSAEDRHKVVIAPSSTGSSEEVITRFIQKNSGQIKRLEEEPVLLVQKKNTIDINKKALFCHWGLQEK